MEIPPPQRPQVLAGGVGRFGQTQCLQCGCIRHPLQRQRSPGSGKHRQNARRAVLLPIAGRRQHILRTPRQPVVVGQPFGLPAQKTVKGAGVGPDVVAGHHTSPQQAGQGVHQLQPYAVMPFGCHPDADPHIGPFRRAGGDIPGHAQQPPVLLGYSKLRRTVPPQIVVAEQLRTVDQRQTQVEMLVDKRSNGAFLAPARQTADQLRQWPNLPLQAV